MTCSLIFSSGHPGLGPINRRSHKFSRGSATWIFQSLLINRRPEVNLHSEAQSLVNWQEAAYKWSSIMEGQTSLPLDKTLWLQFRAVPPNPHSSGMYRCYGQNPASDEGTHGEWSVAKVSHSRNSLSLLCFPDS